MPPALTSKGLWTVCAPYGRLVDAFIANKLSKGVEINNELFEATVQEIDSWCIKITDDYIDLSSNDNIKDVDTSSESIDDHSVDDLEYIQTNLNNIVNQVSEQKMNKNEENKQGEEDINLILPQQPPKEEANNKESNPECKVESSDLSRPPGFEFMKKSSSPYSKCSTSFARFRKKDIKDTTTTRLWRENRKAAALEELSSIEKKIDEGSASPSDTENRLNLHFELKIIDKFASIGVLIQRDLVLKLLTLLFSKNGAGDCSLLQMIYGLKSLKAFFYGHEGGFDNNGCSFKGTWANIVGSSNFLHLKDIWVGEAPLSIRTNIGVRNLAFFRDMLNEIDHLNIVASEDTCVWNLGPNGTFTVKDARNIIDQKTLPSLPSTSWDKIIPRKRQFDFILDGLVEVPSNDRVFGQWLNALFQKAVFLSRILPRGLFGVSSKTTLV
ncbi:hypothetical protein Tco_0112027 [Tanacetum coccineum]